MTFSAQVELKFFSDILQRLLKSFTYVHHIHGFCIVSFATWHTQGISASFPRNRAEPAHMEDTELAEVLLHHVSAVITLLKVAIRVRRAVAALADALQVARQGLDVLLRAEPGDVVRGEERVSALFKI
jgi:hypothetical protein